MALVLFNSDAVTARPWAGLEIQQPPESTISRESIDHIPGALRENGALFQRVSAIGGGLNRNFESAADHPGALDGDWVRWCSGNAARS
jgi:hypothetical protein